MPNSSLKLKPSAYLITKTYAFPIIAVVSFLFLLWRAKFGYCFNDEPFIISLAQRLYQGDALIVDEWHLAQTCGPVLLPFYALFRLFSASNEGIMLCFRYTYCVLWWLSCLLIYKKLSGSEGRLGAVLVFLYLILFSPLDYMTLSYTSLALISCLFLCLILYRLPNTRQALRPGKLLPFSFWWVVLVLCSPFMAISYVLLLLIAGAGSHIEKKRSSLCYFRNLFSLCIASLPLVAAVCALYLYAFIFSRAEFSQFMQAIPFVLNDPQHEKRNIIKAILSTPGYVAMDAPIFVLTSFAVFALAMLRNCKKQRLGLFSLCAVLYICAQLVYSKSVLPGYDGPYPLLNHQMMHIGILGMAAFALLEKRPYKLFLVFQGMGWIFALMQNLASNTRIMTIAMSLTVIGISGIICCLLLAGELREQYAGKKLFKRLSLVLVCLVLSVQIGSELFTRLYRTYYDDTLSALNSEIRYGAAKGLMTTAENADNYNRLYENLSYLLSGVDTEGKRFMCSSETPHMYLDADMDYGVFSSWNCFLGPELMTSQLENYLSISPENMPDIIFSGSENDILPFTDSGYTRMEYRGSYLFIKE